jgi:hypothetical protein
MPLIFATEWARLTVESLNALIVSEERREWILERYPPTDVGRPGVLHHTPRGEKLKAVREMDTDAPVEVDADRPSWRKTSGFAGDEDALELAEVAAD